MTTDRDTPELNAQPLFYGDFRGGPGNDYIFGPRASGGSDLYGGDGDDKIFSENGSNAVRHNGGDGNDIIYGGDNLGTLTLYEGDFTRN